ncbi:MAG: hypothetical protein DMF64_09530 [Acidobacteria bacterium]|nr:MAG: hypothetical protein DMF64_09530 [Acidobacteriota bacterium]
MKNTFIKASLTLALMGALGLLTFAQTPAPQTNTPSSPPAGRFERGGRHGHMGRGMRGGFARPAFSQLNLTDAQHQQLADIHQRYGQNFKAQREELRQLMETRRSGGTLTPEQQARAQELHAQLRANNEKMHSETLAVLTQEQRDQLKQMREQFHQRMEEQRGPRFKAQPNTNPPTDN